MLPKIGLKLAQLDLWCFTPWIGQKMGPPTKRTEFIQSFGSITFECLWPLNFMQSLRKNYEQFLRKVCYGQTSQQTNGGSEKLDDHGSIPLSLHLHCQFVRNFYKSRQMLKTFLRFRLVKICDFSEYYLQQIFQN